MKKVISYLNARQDDDEAAVLKFKLMTDANASEGTYDLDIVTTYKSGSDLHQLRLHYYKNNPGRGSGVKNTLRS